MEVHSSEQESEYSNSNVESMSPQSQDSPVSSPCQMVPQLAQAFRGISCSDGQTAIVGLINTGPFLRITEQPMEYFRFRYKSEMVGTHGCILGRFSGPRNKTHPAVELMNCSRPAVIRVQLAQANREDVHPHKLLVDDEDRDVIAQLPQQGSYNVAFPGMGIIHTAKKDVPGLLFTKMMKMLEAVNEPDIKAIRSHCESAAKKIDLNKVRLKFSAHDPDSDELLCPQVYSDPIHNMKSASTNDLKICRISRVSGRARGGDDVYLLVEKVNKKNVRVRFFELNNYGEEVWYGFGNFLQTDVHHQYAIVLRTPAYQDPNISRDVKVFIELVRPTDGRVSEPKEFTYKADPVFKNKKRRINSSISSIGSGSGGSLSSIGDIPVTVAPIMSKSNNGGDLNGHVSVYQIEGQIPQAPTSCMQPSLQPSNDLADALLFDVGASMTEPDLSPMLSQPMVSEPPIIQINSSEFQRLIDQDQELSLDEKNTIGQADLNAYMQLYDEIGFQSNKSNSMDFFRTSMQLVSDSGQAKEIKQEIKLEPIGPSPSKGQSPTEANNLKMSDRMKAHEYTAHYKAEQGREVKQLVKEICEMIKNKSGFKKYVVCAKLERLMELRLSNGDTFLHMTLSSNQPSFEYIVRLIHSLRLTHLLNADNDLGQTILHLAVVNALPAVVSMLIANGCSVSACDRAGLSPLHYAVSRRECLRTLIDALPKETLKEAINIYCNEKQTALHLAAIENEPESARMLLAAGADESARDLEGRTPLHLATYDDYLDVTQALLEFIPASEIDAMDGRGNTALQIVCGAGMRTNTLAIAKLLLDKQADPVKCWHLTRDDAFRALLKSHMSRDRADVKSEPEDEFESADDGEFNTVTETVLIS